MGRIVIACFRPRPGQVGALRQVVAKHNAILRSQGLVTDREPVIMEAGDGTIIEVFEWKSPEAIDAAHKNPVVQAMWQDYEAACEYIPLNALGEAGALFPDFTPLGG